MPTGAFISARGTSTSSPLTLTTPTSIAVGSVLVLAGFNSSNQNLTSLSDTRGNTWTLHHQGSHPANGVRAYFASCRVDTAYQSGDTITWAGLTGSQMFEVLELGPVSFTDYFDTSAQAASGTNAGQTSSGNITTSGACIIVGASGWAASLGESLGSASGFTMHAYRANGNNRIATGYRISSASETVQFNYDHSGTVGANAVTAIGSFHVRPPSVGSKIVVVS